MCMEKSLVSDEQALINFWAIPEMAELSAEDLHAFIKLGRFEQHAKGSRILSRNRPGPAMCILLSGRVKVYLSAPDGKEFVLSYLDAPTHFGEMSLTDSGLRSANVVAASDVQLFSVESGNLAEAIQVNPRLALALVASLSRRLLEAVTLLEDMAFRDATHRVMRVILNIATACCEAKGFPAVEGFTHHEISLLAGTSRETASRVISSLAKDEIVATKGRKIVVDIVKLRQRLERE